MSASRMNSALPAPARLVLPVGAVVSGVALGGLAAIHPALALGLVAGMAILTLAFVAPVSHLVLLVLVTLIVPFSLQNRLSFGGGQGTPGIVMSDVLLVGGLARAALALLDVRFSRRAKLVVALLLSFLVLCVLQFVRGVGAGHDTAVAGLELRTLLGFAVALIALPLLADPRERDRLFAGLLGVGLALGLWGLAQWLLHVPFTSSGDAGVREGVRYTTTGRGQIQGGMYGFPVAVLVAVAVLLAQERKSALQRIMLISVVALNCADLLLTYERTFWVATLIGLVFVVVKAGRRRRMRAVIGGGASVALVVAAFAISAPAELTAARQRLSSVGQYGTDNSVRYRIVESRHVSEQIRARPLAGSGLGATLLWGRPYEGVRPTLESYSHNGYLWLTWKLGIPVAAMLVLMLALAAAGRAPVSASTTAVAVTTGAQASLLALLVASATFPTFNALGITATMGLLVAIAVGPWRGALRLPGQQVGPSTRRARPATAVHAR